MGTPVVKGGNDGIAAAFDDADFIAFGIVCMDVTLFKVAQDGRGVDAAVGV